MRLHLSSVPLGVFLSSGVDSSAVANLAQKANEGPVHTFTLAFEEEEYDEGKNRPRRAGDRHRRTRRSCSPRASSSRKLDRAVESLDQPTFDGLNAYFMSHAVRRAGFTVALVGTGGDELFGGYSSFRDLPALHRWSRGWPLDRAARAVGARSWRHGCAPSSQRETRPADPLGEAPGDGPARRRPCWRSTSSPTRCSFPKFQRELVGAPPAHPRWMACRRRCAGESAAGLERGIDGRILRRSASLEQRALPRRAAAARQRRREHGGVARTARAAGRPVLLESVDRLRIRSATSRSAEKLFCGALDCAVLIRRCSSDPRADLSCHSIGGSAAG